MLFVIRVILLEGVRKTGDGVPEDEENFEEAIKAVNIALHDSSILSTELKAVLEHPSAVNITGEVSEKSL